MIKLILVLSFCSVFSVSQAMQAILEKDDTVDSASRVLFESKNILKVENERLPKKQKVEATAEMLFSAVQQRKIARIVELLNAGVPIDATQGLGYTALHQAAGSRSLEVVKVLLEEAKKRRMDIVNIRRLAGQTSLHEAAERGHVAVVYLLLEHGADTFATDQHGETALDKARHSYELFEGAQFRMVIDLLVAYNQEED